MRLNTAATVMLDTLGSLEISSELLMQMATRDHSKPRRARLTA